MKLNEKLTVEKVFVEDTDKFKEFYYVITNNSDEDIWVDDVLMYDCDCLEKLGVRDDSFVFRSGRHKNDMPGVFQLGKMDEAMKDVLGVMSEVGDKQDGEGNTIVSDHLTIIGNENNFVVVSFETGKNQMFRTEIVVDDEGNFNEIRSYVEFNIKLENGAQRKTETIRIEHVEDAMKAIDDFAAKKAKLYGSRNDRRLSVFCTWYYYGLTVTYDDVKTNLDIMKQKKLPFDVFQVDEGWEIVLGEWKPNKKFPLPMKTVAEQIKEAGYIPGIWTSPFVAHETCTIWKEHPDWILKDKDGNPCLFPMNDMFYYIFDITIKETWDYFYELYHMLTFDWGYVYHKLDFTRAAVIIPDAAYKDDTITLTEAYTEAVKAIRRGMGEDSYFLMCGGLYDPLIGIVDAQRTGSDVLSMWSSNINKGGKTAPYTIKQSILRYYMNSWWNNDPDALMVRRNETMERDLRLTYGLLTDEEVKTSVINQFIGGGIVCSTEPLDKIEDDRLYELRRIMPIVDSKVRPINIMNSNRFPENVMVIPTDGSSVLVARINWSDDDEMVATCTITDDIVNYLYGEKDDKYIAVDYYGGIYKKDLCAGETVELAPMKPHASTIIKIEKQSDKPVIVKSTGHFSMNLSLKDVNDFNYPMNYEII